LTLDVDEDDDDEGGLDPLISSIALHRIVAVCAGVLWGMFITSYIWPISARFNMRVGLSELYLHLGWFFRTNKEVAGVPEVKTSGPNVGSMERAVEYSPLSRIRPYLKAEQELALQGLLSHLRGLLTAASNEPRLKVFPLLTVLRVGSVPGGCLPTITIECAENIRYLVPFSSHVC